ncbi:MAG: heat-inducible transcriptional repressor HrcA [Chlamydiia bacterium]|nr:heat-inducible transcriptional repressor HrcA [Chlamydiia bacterium]
MKSLRPLAIKQSKKQEREFRVLLGLVELYLQTGKPIGSNTLKDAGFPELSSATIRNYFAGLEEDGYLVQQHSSGGRIPTAKAFRAFARSVENAESKLSAERIAQLQTLKQQESREIASYLQNASEMLSGILNLPVFLSAPRFDHDFVLDMKLLRVDAKRCLVVIITDFGLIQTEVLPLSSKVSTFALHRMEAYFHWRLTGYGKPENMKPDEERLAQQLYNEIMVRYIVTYSNCSYETVYQTGFSRLLAYPEFNDASALAGSLSLFENSNGLRLLLRDTANKQRLEYWVGEDLHCFGASTDDCSAVAVPYRINQQVVGALGVLGPTRMPYRSVFASLRHAADSISEIMTRSIYKFKISYRQPKDDNLFLAASQETRNSLTPPMLLEDQRDA